MWFVFCNFTNSKLLGNSVSAKSNMDYYLILDLRLLEESRLHFFSFSMFKEDYTRSKPLVKHNFFPSICIQLLGCRHQNCWRRNGRTFTKSSLPNSLHLDRYCLQILPLVLQLKVSYNSMHHKDKTLKIQIITQFFNNLNNVKKCCVCVSSVNGY